MNINNSRSEVKKILSRVEYIKQKYMHLEEEIVQLSGQAEYDRAIQHYDHLITMLEKEFQSLPIGYRYTGRYFLKKPYTLPPEYEEHTGSIFMYEHLVSWQVEIEPGKYDYAYHRAVHKEPNGPYLTREDADPVYKNNEKVSH